MKPIYVTQPSLAPLDEYVEELKKVWESGILTHNGPLVQKLENEICNEGLNGDPDFNCSALFFDGDCLDGFENCIPDCPVGILDFGNISVDLEDNVIVGQLEIVMDCEFDVTNFSINSSCN